MPTSTYTVSWRVENSNRATTFDTLASALRFIAVQSERFTGIETNIELCCDGPYGIVRMLQISNF